MPPEETPKGVNVTTSWTELKSQPVRELTERAFGTPQPDSYGEPMRDPELADILDYLELHVLEIEALRADQLPRSADKELEITQIIFRICEASRHSELDGPPPSEIATNQLQRAVTLHDRALQKIDQLRSTHATVPKWTEHIRERRESFLAELNRRSPTRQVAGLLDQFEQDVAELCKWASKLRGATADDEKKLSALIGRVRDFTRYSCSLAAASDSISTELLDRAAHLHKSAADNIRQLKLAEEAIAAVNEEIKERGALFTRLLRDRQPN